jgi:putative membrane protein
MMNGGWEGWFLGPFTMLAFIIVVVALIIFLVRWLGGGPVHGPRSSGMPGAPERPDRAMDVLRERYAKGEINREEFEERRRTLLSD